MTEHRLSDREDDLDEEDVTVADRWTFALDDDGDLRFDDETNSFATLVGPQAVRQSLAVALMSHRGDDPLDERFGLDRFNATTTLVGLEREVRKTLYYDDAEHDRVERIVDYTYEYHPSTRHADVEVVVQLDTGEPTVLRFDLEML